MVFHRGWSPTVFILLLSMVLLVTAGVFSGCKYLPWGKKTPPPATAPAPGAKAPTDKAPEAKAPEAAEKPKETFAYAPGGRRDPFKPLLVAKVEGEKVKGDPKKSLEVGDLKLVGIIWDKRGFYYALVETPQGIGYTLRTKDQIGLNAVVRNITQEAVYFDVRTRTTAGPKGDTSEVVLKLRKED